MEGILCGLNQTEHRQNRISVLLGDGVTVAMVSDGSCRRPIITLSRHLRAIRTLEHQDIPRESAIAPCSVEEQMTAKPCYANR